MKRLVGVLLILAFFAVPAAAVAKQDCVTTYPVVFAHGMGLKTKIVGIVDYWWGIEDALKKRGAKVYFTTVNAMDSTASKGKTFAAQFEEILAISGAEKAHIIGHSHGTIYTRYAISNLGIGSKVASYTSISGPHRGSRLGDVILRLPDVITGPILDFVFSWVMGDTDPDSHQNFIDITPKYMKDTFNPNTPDVEGLYYQSWACRGKWAAPSGILQPTWMLMLFLEGANDGLVGVESAKWGDFKGVEKGAWYSPGVDHANVIGHLLGVTPGFSAPEFYAEIIKGLKGREQ